MIIVHGIIDWLIENGFPPLYFWSDTVCGFTLFGEGYNSVIEGNGYGDGYDHGSENGNGNGSGYGYGDGRGQTRGYGNLRGNGYSIISRERW